MPTYEYRCDACGHQFEEFQKISDLPIDRCPKCKKKKARRQISQGNFILKGGGWYVTDYKTGGGRKKDRDDKAASAKSDDKKSDETKSSDAKSGDAKSADTKSGETKPADKKSESKDDRPAKKAADK